MPIPDDSSSEAADAVLIGARIRARRRELGLTLHTVGERIGVSKSYLGQVETARLTASLGLLERISGVLRVPIRTLLAAPGDGGPTESPRDRTQRPVADRRVFVTRADRRTALVAPGGRAPVQVLTPDLQRQFEVTQSADPSGGWHEVDRSRITAEEFVHVLEGSYELEVGGTVHSLHPGDSMTFYPTASYRVRSTGPGPARAIWVTLPATS